MIPFLYGFLLRISLQQKELARSKVGKVRDKGNVEANRPQEMR
jgi:hypothetical protein